MLTKPRNYFTPKIVFSIFFFLICSLHMHAIKKSTAGVNNPSAQGTRVVVDKNERPSLFQRLSEKILSKRLKKKIAKFKERSANDSKLKKGMAVAALVLGIVAFVTSFVGIAAAILAIIFGAIGMKRAREQPEVFGGRKMAIAGLVLGIVYLSIIAVFLLILAASLYFFF